MALNKVVYKNRTLMDLTNTTAVESDVLNGKVFYKADGSAAMGTNGNSLQLQLKNFSTGDYTSPQSAYQVEIGPMSLICAKTSDDGSGGGSGVGYVWQDENGYVHLSDQPAAQLITRPLIVAQNGTYTPANGSAYSSVTVSVPQPSGTLNITENNTYDVTNYANAVVNVQDTVSKKQVNFIDYDGTLLYSYSKADWQNITTLPDNPSHTGLTAQGWNWTKNQIDAQLVAVPDGVVWVGQMYITDDEKTRIYIHLEEGRLHPYFGICPNGTVSIDWGDNSTADTLTGTSLTTVKTIDHTYASGGDYIITLTVSNGSFQFYGTGNTTYLLRKDTSTTTIVHRMYSNAVRKIEMGANANIGTYAFNYCCSLKNITIPNNVTSIGTYAFQNCYSLLSIIIPNGVTSIGNYTFNYCYSFKKIAIPCEITSIGSYVFQYCQSLLSITIPNGVTSISGYTFRYCYSLKSIVIPNGVTSIGNYAFANCNSLFEIILPNSITSIGTYAFSVCYSLANFTMPSGVTNLNNYMFQNCCSIKNIIIPDEATSIPTYAFSGCYSLVAITIPSGVTSIAASAFSACYSLAKITIPSGVTSIAASAFNACYGLAEIHFESTTPPTCANINAWSSIQTDCKIYVPTGSLESYTTAANYPSSQTYTYIEE